MSNCILVVSNRSFEEIDTSLQAHIETSLARVCGAKLGSCDSIGDVIGKQEFSNTIFAVTVRLPKYESEVQAVRREIARHVPVAGLFGVIFLLCPGEGFSVDSLLGNRWVDTLDSMYEHAVPVSFTVLHGDHPQVQTFHMVAAVSGLFRDLDNLEEMRRIGEILYDLEDRVENLQVNPEK